MDFKKGVRISPVSSCYTAPNIKFSVMTVEELVRDGMASKS